MATPIRILGIAGSLRKDSYNKSTLRTAVELAPENVTLEVFERLGEIPLFNQDLERELPPAVADLKTRIKAADGILFVTPEYNYSIPGVLKNAIDWASRPDGQSAWSGKPAAIIGASPGRFGTVRSQAHLRQCLVTLNMPTVNKPEALISNAKDHFDASGKLTDEKTRQVIAEVLKSLVALIER